MNIVPLPPRFTGSIINLDWAELLEKSIPLVWDGVGYTMNRQQTSFICIAIAMSEDSNALEEIATGATNSNGLVLLIEERLRLLLDTDSFNCDDYTFDKWAAKFGRFNNAEIQAGRVAWMKQLASEFRGETL